MLLVPLDMSLPRRDARAQMRNIVSARMSHELTFPVQAAALGIVTSASTRHLPTSWNPEGLSKVHSLLFVFFSRFCCCVFGLTEEQGRPTSKDSADCGAKALRSSPGTESCCLRGGDMVLMRPSPGGLSTGSPHPNKKKCICFPLRNRFSLA